MAEGTSVLGKMINAHAEILTVDTLFHEAYYEIPSYQREFSWKTEHVKALIDDLIEAYNSRDIHIDYELPQYFLGAIVSQARQTNDLGEADRASKVVDGQQRLTCLMLVIAVLCKLLSQDEEDLASEVSERLQPELVRSLLTLIFRSDDDHFILNSTGYNYYLRQLMGGRGGLPRLLLGQPPFKTTAIQKFCAAFELLEKELLKEIARVEPGEKDPDLDRKSLQEFANWFRSHVFVALIADTDPYDDQRLFDRMNTRGMPLSEAEKFKSQVIAARKNKNPGTDASNKWQKTKDKALSALNVAGQSGSLAVRDPNEAERRLLSGWVIAKHVSLDDLSLSHRRKIKSISLDPYDYCLEHVGSEENDLLGSGLFEALKGQYFSYVSKLKKTYLPMYSFSPEFAGFQHAQIVKLPYLDALIAACFVRIPQRESKQRLILTSHLIDLLSIQRAWNRHWATKDQVEVTILRAIKLLRTERVSNINSAFFELLRDAPILNSDNAPALVSSNKRWIRYFLGRLAYELEIKNGKKPNKNLIDGKGPASPEIEHIFSRRFQDNGDGFHFDRQEIETWRQRLGALTILSRIENRLASNKTWEQRKPIYGSSNLLSKTLVEDSYDNNLRLRTKSVELKNYSFQPWGRISKNEITKRELAYTQLASNIWSLDRLR